MKNSLLASAALLLSLSLGTNVARAQEKGQVYAILEPGYQTTISKVGLFDSHMRGFTFRTVVGMHIDQHLGLGLGLGVDGFRASNSPGTLTPSFNTAPLVGDVRYFFGNNLDKGNVYLSAHSGYSVRLSDNYSEGFLAGAGAGYRFTVGRGTKLTAGLRYNYQQINFFRGMGSGSLDVQTIGLNVGLFL